MAMPDKDVIDGSASPFTTVSVVEETGPSVLCGASELVDTDSDDVHAATHTPHEKTRTSVFLRTDRDVFTKYLRYCPSS